MLSLKRHCCPPSPTLSRKLVHSLLLALSLTEFAAVVFVSFRSFKGARQVRLITLSYSLSRGVSTLHCRSNITQSALHVELRWVKSKLEVEQGCHVTIKATWYHSWYGFISKSKILISAQTSLFYHQGSSLLLWLVLYLKSSSADSDVFFSRRDRLLALSDETLPMETRSPSPAPLILLTVLLLMGNS